MYDNYKVEVSMNLTKGWQVCRAAGQCCIVLVRRVDNAVLVFVVCETLVHILVVLK